MAGLTRAREEEKGLVILVLDAWDGRIVFFGDVEFELAGGVWVERFSDFADCSSELFTGGIPVEEAPYPAKVIRAEHLSLGKHQAEDGICV